MGSVAIVGTAAGVGVVRVAGIGGAEDKGGGKAGLDPDTKGNLTDWNDQAGQVNCSLM